MSGARLSRWAAVAALALTAGWVMAQDEFEDVGMDDAAVEVDEPVDAEPGISKDIKTRPSDVLPLSSRGLLLDVVNTGKRFVAVGTRATILLSVTGKPSEWAQVQAPVRSPLTAVFFADEQNGWAVGHDAVILNTRDGGRSWALQNFQPELEKPFLDVLFLDSRTGFAVGAYGLFYRTADGGSTWKAADAPEIRGPELHFNSITRLADGRLFIAGEQGTLGLSADNGETWKKLPSPYEGSYFGALPVGEKGALMYGLRGHMYLSDDVGNSPWRQVATDSVVSLFGGTKLADGRAALAGINGTILLVDPATAQVREQRVKIREADKVGIERERILASTFSAAVPLGEGLLLVGEEGVRTTALIQ
jgi:photosystem II stability/assembly factor-like uncharacterized protein